MPLYQCQPPTGYKDTADAWANTGAIVEPHERGAGARRRPTRRHDGQSGGRAAPRSKRSLPGLSDTTRATIARATNDAERLALTLGSPEFQRR